MKKVIILFFLGLLCSQKGFSQEQDSVTFYLSTSDTTILANVINNQDGSVTPVFTNQEVNQAVAPFHFSTFTQAFPTSRFPYLRSVYKVTTTTEAAATTFTQTFPAIFPAYELCGAPTLLYTPNDWNAGWYTYPWYLDYIHARQAWDYTHGSSSVVVGITDTWLDVTNPDFAGKIARVGPNVMGSEPWHGTQTSGRIACATDNSIGYPSIGFNCMLDFSSNWGSDNEMLVLSSTYGRKILNGSWLNNGTADLATYLATHPIEQGIYDEIYENGTSTCFAAGNGSGSGFAPPLYCFPASYDNVISTTNIMGENCSWSGGSGPGCDVHDINIGDTVHDYQHNTRVDVCAPAIRVGGIDYNTSFPVGNDNRYYCHDCGWGTSYASPLTAGTMGLIMSENSCLSPYQREYCLKMGSRASIYSVSDNWYLSSPPRIGAGALDAENAVSIASTLSCNDVATQSLYINGIEFNTLCVPGLSSNGAKPVLVPVISNGTPPYTYRWDALPGNTTTLDNYTSANPTVISSSGANLVYYRLTVYDASSIQKVASRVVKISLTSTADYLLGSRDSYLDMFDEPNSQATVDPREWNIWASPDIWNRHTADGITTPQNIEYYYSGAPNYMYVRVRNVGCRDYTAANNAVIHAYWTLASTGEHWAVDWNGSVSVCGVTTPQPAGGEITSGAVPPVHIPTLHPGDQFLAPIPWHPVDPTLYCGAPTNVDVCGLARITDPSKPNMGINTTEVDHISDNVRNSNHIVTRNMEEVDLGHATPSSGHRIYVGNTGQVAQVFGLQMITDRDIQAHFGGDLSSVLNITVQLDNNLFQAWASGGFQGTYGDYNEQTHTVTYVPGSPFELRNITLQPGVHFYADLTFALTPNAQTDNVAGQNFHIRQLLEGQQGGDQLYGDVSYYVNIVPDSKQGNKPLNTPVTKPYEQIANHYTVYPNPTSGIVKILHVGANATGVDVTVVDATGRIMVQKTGLVIADGAEEHIDISSLPIGIYVVNIQDANGYKQSYKITKVD